MKNSPAKPLKDLSEPVALTASVIERLACPAGKQQAFLRDAKVQGLRVRVTAKGAKSFVYEAKLHRQTIRRTIGSVDAWSVEEARAEARQLAVMLDQGKDPRELERQQREQAELQRITERSLTATFGQAWDAYIAERSARWSQAHLNNHLRAAQAGGAVALRGTRGKGVTAPGSLYPFMAMELRSITSAKVEAWAIKEAAARQSTARLGWVLLKAFLNWCSEHPEYAQAMPDPAIASTRRISEAFGPALPKTDSLLREQLPAWFRAVQTQEPVAQAYLQVLLLTGARPSEVRELQWSDIDWHWKLLHLRDKVEGKRTIPLTPYVEHLLQGMPRKGSFVFASLVDSSKPITPPRKALQRVCEQAGISPVLTLHGLRRSFKSLTEWQSIPVGAVAQIQGHKPSATVEKHYAQRETGLLRMHLESIEKWMLEHAGVQFDGTAPRAQLRAV